MKNIRLSVATHFTHEEYRLSVATHFTHEEYRLSVATHFTHEEYQFLCCHLLLIMNTADPCNAQKFRSFWSRSDLIFLQPLPWAMHVKYI
jgi:hypothetical protein